MKKQDLSIKVSQREKLKGQLQLKPFPWTDKQKEFLKLASDKDIKIIFVKGPAGSAKTLLATYSSLDLLNQKKVSDILYVRSAVESADSKIGFLPGDLEDKVYYYGVPFFDKLAELLTKPEIESLKNDSRIQVFPINYVRGLSWNAKSIIIDEAQNMTDKELITVLTRIGKFSKCFVLADPEQSDINGKSGAFLRISELFKDEEAKAQGIVTFELDEFDIMRSDLCRFLVGRFKFLGAKK